MQQLMNKERRNIVNENLLRNFSILKNMSAIEMQQLFDLMHITTFEKKSFIYAPKQKADKIYFLKDGKIKINSFSEDGKELIHAINIAGDVFGEMAVFGEAYRMHYAEALEDSTVFYVSVDTFSMFLSKISSLNNALNKLIGLRLTKTRNRLERLWFLSARERIIMLLHDLSKEHGIKTVLGIAIKLFLTHKDMAALASASRQTVTSVLAELENNGFIKYNRSHLLLKHEFSSFYDTKAMIG